MYRWVIKSNIYNRWQREACETEELWGNTENVKEIKGETILWNEPRRRIKRSGKRA